MYDCTHGNPDQSGGSAADYCGPVGQAEALRQDLRSACPHASDGRVAASQPHRSDAQLGRHRPRLFRYLVGLALPIALCLSSIAHAGVSIKSTLGMRATTAANAVVGTTPAQIHANFAVTFVAHLKQLQAKGGDMAVYNFLWSLSSFQLYEAEAVYNQAAVGHTGIPLTMISM